MRRLAHRVGETTRELKGEKAERLGLHAMSTMTGE
jgi:hypothetical protein